VTVFNSEQSLKNLEREIANRFDLLWDTPMVTTELAPRDFELCQVLEWIGNPTGQRILDAGCGKGKFVSYLAGRGGKVIGIDRTERFIHIAQKNAPEAIFQVASLTKLPFADNTFNAVLCIEVLQHIPDYWKAIEEMTRVLRKNGRIIIIDKNIRSLEPRYLVPTFLWKSLLEHFNMWMYPRNFPFKEHLFRFEEIEDLLKGFCHQTASQYMTKGQYIHSNIVYKKYPSLSFFISWKGIK